jgi:hypothetical protein
MADQRRGPLTGRPDPEWDTSEPWQLQQSRKVIEGFASESSTARHARRVLWLCTAAALGVLVVGVLLSLALDVLT